VTEASPGVIVFATAEIVAAAVAAAFVCIAVVVIGTRYWGWTW